MSNIAIGLFVSKDTANQMLFKYYKEAAHNVSGAKFITDLGYAIQKLS